MSSQNNTTAKAQVPEATKASGKKRYNAPRLNSFGMVTDLTAGGSGRSNETHANPGSRAFKP